MPEGEPGFSAFSNSQVPISLAFGSRSETFDFSSAEVRISNTLEAVSKPDL
jgi:hypothetical protein